jgi:hypothetical protein
LLRRTDASSHFQYKNEVPNNSTHPDSIATTRQPCV